MGSNDMRRWLTAAMAISMAASAGCFKPAHPIESYNDELPPPANNQSTQAPQETTTARPTPPPAPVTPTPQVVHAEPPPPQPAVSDHLRQDALHELVSETGAADPRLRSNAIEALGDVAPDQAVDPAINGLTDPDQGVQFSALMTVGKLKLAQAHQQLLHMHDAKPDVVQVGVRFALHRIGDTQYSHDLERYAHNLDPEIRGKTALALGLLEEPSAVVVLRPLRKDPESSVRMQASTSLWLLHDQAGLDDLAAYAISKFPDDLILATLGLAGPRDQRVLPHIEANLTADYPEVCLAAARACGQLGSDEGYAIAIKGAHSSDPRQKLLAALALGDIGRTDAQPVLAKLLSDPAPEVRIGAAKAILELAQH